MSEFTVVVGSARGAFDDIEEAQEEARRLFRLNAPDPVTILDENGDMVFEITVDPTGQVAGLENE